MFPSSTRRCNFRFAHDKLQNVDNFQGCFAQNVKNEDSGFARTENMPENNDITGMCAGLLSYIFVFR